MALRFRKSIRLVPGLRLNIGSRGLSLSAGVPGATVNFSPRGARATFGVPGSGFSWSHSVSSGQLPERYQHPNRDDEESPINTVAELEDAIRNPRTTVVYAESRRRLSAQQLEAMHRRLTTEERRRAAAAHIAQQESELLERLECWRDMPTIPNAADYHAALQTQPFVYERPSPTLLALDALENEVRTASIQSSEVETPVVTSALSALIGFVGTALAAGLYILLAESELMYLSVVPVVSATITAIVVQSIRKKKRREAVELAAKHRFEHEWPIRRAEAVAENAARTAAFEADRAAAETEWIASEDNRTSWAARLGRGDEDAIHEAICSSLEDLDFPFETHVEFATGSPHHGFLHIDLPEIEDVVSETQLRVLQDGTIKEQKRDERGRNAVYATCAAGVGLMMAAAAFAAAPTLRSVYVAGYTQREQRGKRGEIDDDYVYVAEIFRERISELDRTTCSSVEILQERGLIEIASTFKMKRLNPAHLPDWVGVMRQYRARTHESPQ